MPQAKSTAWGRDGRSGSAIFLLALPMQHANQRKQPARRIDIDRNLTLEPLYQDARAVVVDRAAAHIDRLDLVGRRGADRLIITVADHVVVLDDPVQRRA